MSPNGEVVLLRERAYHNQPAKVLLFFGIHKGSVFFLIKYLFYLLVWDFFCTFAEKLLTWRRLDMRVLLINGSPHAKGNTSIALAEVAKILEQEGIETVTVGIGVQPVRGCVACGSCRKNNTTCAFSDALYDRLLEILKEGVDGLVVGSPVYYAGPNGSLCALLDRLFYSAGTMLAYKPAAAVAVCRRGGASATFDRLNKYFTINNMPVVPSQYWISVHGAAAGEALEDLEGLQTMRTLARNMAWMLRDLQAKNIPMGEDKKIKTSFVR